MQANKLTIIASQATYTVQLVAMKRISTSRTLQPCVVTCKVEEAEQDAQPETDEQHCDEHNKRVISHRSAP